MRDITNGLAGAVYDTAAPLSGQQADEVTRILAHSSAMAVPFLGHVNWEAALPLARAVLSPDQYAALQNEVTVINAGSLRYGLNPAQPGTFGDGLTPPSALFAIGTRPK